MPEIPKNPILETAMALMDAAVPGMFEQPAAAWRDYVPGLRYVVIERAEGLNIEQLKTVRSFSSSFCNCSAKNLIEVRRALATEGIRLEPIGESWASENLAVLASDGIRAHLEELSEEEQCERLKILDDLPPPDSP